MGEVLEGRQVFCHRKHERFGAERGLSRRGGEEEEREEEGGERGVSHERERGGEMVLLCVEVRTYSVGL